MSKDWAAFNAAVAKLRLWLKDQFVADVSPEDACCEFECRKTQCRFGDWVNCSARLSYLAATVPKDSRDVPPTEIQ
jgi:hypothetical protein